MIFVIGFTILYSLRWSCLYVNNVCVPIFRIHLWIQAYNNYLFNLNDLAQLKRDDNIIFRQHKFAQNCVYKFMDLSNNNYFYIRIYQLIMTDLGHLNHIFTHYCATRVELHLKLNYFCGYPVTYLPYIS